MKTTRPIFPTPTTFTTTRLLLRPMTLVDLEDLYTLRTQIEVMKWTSTTKIDANREATTLWMHRFLPPNDSKTFNFCVEELEDPGKVIGVLGLHLPEPPECGYMFRKEFWGKGFATEAFKAWLQKYWALPRVEIEVDNNDETAIQEDTNSIQEYLDADIESRNIASQRVLEKCGFYSVSSQNIEENGEIVKLVKFRCKRPDL